MASHALIRVIFEPQPATARLVPPARCVSFHPGEIGSLSAMRVFSSPSARCVSFHPLIRVIFEPQPATARLVPPARCVSFQSHLVSVPARLVPSARCVSFHPPSAMRVFSSLKLTRPRAHLLAAALFFCGRRLKFANQTIAFLRLSRLFCDGERGVAARRPRIDVRAFVK